jgi:hypothetical protein
MGIASAAARADVPEIPVPNSGIPEIIWEFLTFEQQWTDEASGRALPKFVTDELHKYPDCGILARGFAHLYCDECGAHQVVA